MCPKLTNIVLRGHFKCAKTRLLFTYLAWLAGDDKSLKFSITELGKFLSLSRSFIYDRLKKMQTMGCIEYITTHTTVKNLPSTALTFTDNFCTKFSSVAGDLPVHPDVGIVVPTDRLCSPHVQSFVVPTYKAPAILYKDNTKNIQEYKSNKYNINNVKSISDNMPTSYSFHFLEFYSNYPNPSGKFEAFKSWSEIKPDEMLKARILKAVQNQILERKIKADYGLWTPQWKSPSNWLRQHAWEDAILDEDGIAGLTGKQSKAQVQREFLAMGEQNA